MTAHADGDADADLDGNWGVIWMGTGMGIAGSRPTCVDPETCPHPPTQRE